MKSFTFIVCIIMMLDLYASSDTRVSDDKALLIQEETFLVYRRYYFVARLDKTIKLLAKMYHEVNNMQTLLADRAIDIGSVLPEEDIRLFTHCLIKRSIDRMCQTKSLKPLFMVWDDFSSYKSLHDDLLVEDFSKEIFIIARNIINRLYKQEKNPFKHVCASDRWLQLNLIERFDVIADMTDHLSSFFKSEPIGQNVSMEKRYGADMSDLKLSIQTDEVAFRFYCIQRLTKAVSLIDALPIEQQKALCVSINNQLQGVDRFRAQKTKSFMQLWSSCVQYKYIENEIFVRDFMFYMLLLLNEYHAKIAPLRASPYADVVAIHQQIEKMPIEQILTAIDTLVTQLSSVVNNYQKSGLTFTQWIGKNWWMPPLVASSIIWQCVKFYYKKFYAK